MCCGTGCIYLFEFVGLPQGVFLAVGSAYDYLFCVLICTVPLDFVDLCLCFVICRLD